MRIPLISTLWPRARKAATRVILLTLTTGLLLFTSSFALSQSAAAYPFWAQQTAPDNPREATGRIVCANCHLAEKPTEVEIPQSVRPDTVFETVVKVPYDHDKMQVLGDGSMGSLNVGAVLMLPEGFKVAPAERLSEEMKAKTAGIYYQPYSEDQENVVLVGPIPGDEYPEIVFPVLSPNPKENKDLRFGKFAVHVGANRGRGQVYPAGNQSNNNVFKASQAGTITKITEEEDGSYKVSIQPSEGDAVVEEIPAGPDLIVSEGEEVAAGDALTENPNVGGFGQEDTEIVLQDPVRIKWLMVFFGGIMLSQIFLVIKKKQVERVQAAEMNF